MWDDRNTEKKGGTINTKLKHWVVHTVRDKR